MNNAGSYNILDDDKYADVFIDLEGNKTETKESEESNSYELGTHDQDSDVNSVQMSLNDIYQKQNEKKDDKFLQKLQV